MACYVDAIVEYDIRQVAKAAQRFGTKWCHLTADSDAELHEMAQTIGVPRSAFQWRSPATGKILIPPYRHYDLIPAKRAAAIKRGAIPVDAATHFVARVEAWRADQAQLGLAPEIAEAERISGVAAVAGVPDADGLTFTSEALRDMAEQMRQGTLAFAPEGRVSPDGKLIVTGFALERKAPRKEGDDGPAQP